MMGDIFHIGNFISMDFLVFVDGMIVKGPTHCRMANGRMANEIIRIV